MINSIRTMESGKKMIKEEDGMIEIEIAEEIADTVSETQKKEGNERTEIAKNNKEESQDKHRRKGSNRETYINDKSTSRSGGNRAETEVSMQKRMDFLEEGMKKISRFITQNGKKL